MKKGSILAVIFVMVVTVTLAFGASEYKLAYVDLQKALNLCKAGQDAKEKFGKEVEKAEAQLSLKQEELQKLKEALEKQSAMLNEETFKKEGERLPGKASRFQETL